MPSLSINLLRQVSGIGAATIRAFVAAGYHTLDDVQDATRDDLLQVAGIGESTADSILEFLQSAAADDPVQAYRYDGETRKNIPPAGLAGQGTVEDRPAHRYSYDPHLPPVLRFDDSGDADQLPELLRTAQERALNEEELHTLRDALRHHRPWLEWAGKREKRWFEVDPVALHIHERVSAEAIIATARRKPLQASLFADPELEYRQALKFYEHEMDWTNRLILGDSLTVMHSLAEREDLAGKVQMIYIDPPYGINYRSNFQPLVNDRDVKDRAADLTREPEQIKAYRDTWQLGIHSYLTYMRDRLKLTKELLNQEGSVFVQISSENVHRLRLILDEIFGPENFISQISFVTTTGRGSGYLDGVYDILLWYAKNKEESFYQQLYKPLPKEQIEAYFTYMEDNNGAVDKLNSSQMHKFSDDMGRLFTLRDSSSQGETESGTYAYQYQGREHKPPRGRHWSTTKEGMDRLAEADRLYDTGSQLRVKRYAKDYPITPINNIWDDTQRGSFTETKVYVVQTSDKVIERCLLMTTRPGDLILDPTCGSGTSAFVAEKWGRRWIAIDTSRVALAVAKQRMLTAKFDYYALKAKKEITRGFEVKTAPHITLKSISSNSAIDSIAAKRQSILEEKLAEANDALTQVTAAQRTHLMRKLKEKENREGKRAITDADERRWLLPKEGERWAAWEIPFDTDPDWPAELQTAVKAYRRAWRQKMDAVNQTIADSAPQETLVDQPQVVKGVTRVSGPFTVEGVQPIEQSPVDDDASPIGGAPDPLADTFDVTREPANVEAYLDKMVALLRGDGVRFPDNKLVKFERLTRLDGEVLHAEGTWSLGGAERRAAVAFGPQYGPITAQQVEEALWRASRRGYDDLVLAGFTIDGAAQAIIQDDPNPRVATHLAHIRPDVNKGMGELLKDTPSSQLFTVFGEPRVRLEQLDDGDYRVEMEGVDIYDPVRNRIICTKAGKVAAWFLDPDYDGQTFRIGQAFFPDKSAWRKLKRALKTLVDADRFAAFSGTVSLPFPVGEHNRAAVKVIDPRGNEVMRIVRLEDGRE